VCRNDTPYLVYEARVGDTASGRMVLHWLDAAGRERMTQTVPLGSGEVLWPGARVDGAGNPVDWPGWIQRTDGQWVEGDDGFLWARPAVRLFASVNPTSVTLGLTYPPATPQCGARPPSTLPPTGGDSQQPLIAVGAALMLVGATFILATRARHARQAG
jgi:LPXTG-motif cell wall-anchored protein